MQRPTWAQQGNFPLHTNLQHLFVAPIITLVPKLKAFVPPGMYDTRNQDKAVTCMPQKTMVKTYDRYTNDAHSVPIMDTKYVAEKSILLREIKCLKKAIWPRNTAKLDRKHMEPSVYSRANFCGTRTIMGKKNDAKIISPMPRAMPMKKYIHLSREMAFS